MLLLKKIEKGIKNPGLIINLLRYKFKTFQKKKEKKMSPLISREKRANDNKQWEWKEENSNINIKSYKTYEEYLGHQKSKLEKIEDKLHSTYDIKYSFELKKRLIKQNIVQPKMNVLCLAARIGTEVKSFLNLGCFAVGLDLNPGKDNKYVVYGDFHHIQFPDKSVDVIFSNSLDHAFDLNKLIKEIKRVLKPEGFLILEIVNGTEENYIPGFYEVMSWKKIEDLLNLFQKAGFTIVNKVEFTYPWKGQHVSLILKKRTKQNRKKV